MELSQAEALFPTASWVSTQGSGQSLVLSTENVCGDLD